MGESFDNWIRTGRIPDDATAEDRAYMEATAAEMVAEDEAYEAKASKLLDAGASPEELPRLMGESGPQLVEYDPKRDRHLRVVS